MSAKAVKTALFGGTFNPPHIAHMAVAEEVCCSLGYERVLFVPAFVPPHKVMAQTVDAKHRIRMLKKAFDGDRRFAVEPCEIIRKGTSYTVDTVKYVLEKYGDQINGRPALIMGQENACEFEKWKDYKIIAALCDIIVAPRFDSSFDCDSSVKNCNTGTYTGGFEGIDYKEHLKELGIDFTELSSFMLPVSSTQIRNKAESGGAFKYLVPKGVFEYICKEKLYGYHN